MPSYLVLGKYTSQGMSRIKESPDRTEGARRAIAAAGGKMGELYLTMGRYDFATIVEAEDDEGFARIILAITSGGTIVTETLRAFTEAERRAIVADMP